MQFFDCCPAAEGNGAIETKLFKQQPFSTRLALNSTPNSTSYNRKCSLESSSMPVWNITNCNSPVNPYHVLELRRDATPAEIIGSYRKLALIYHPGRNVSSPRERKIRMQFFEILAACYETLMHNEFRRRCDVLLKNIEKIQNSETNRQSARSSYQNNVILSEGIISKQQLNRRQSRSIMSDSLVIKGLDSIPGLILSTSQSSSVSGGERSNYSVGNSGESNETLVRNNCTSIGGILMCAAGPSALKATSSSNNSFTISRDGKKGFKSLVDSSSLSQASTEEEAEIHFSEATVNRLFGGPMASLHRARNFQAFSDPYLIFDKVFGNQKPFFPRVTIANNDTTTEDFRGEADDCQENGNGNYLFRPPTSQLSQPRLEPFSTLKKYQNKNMNKSFGDNNANDQAANTKVFVSSRIVNGRKITKTETVHVDPTTGIASVNVTVDGEYLEPIRSKMKLSQPFGTSVADWLLCFGTAKVTPVTRSANSVRNLSSPKSALCHPKKECDCTNADKLPSSCHSFKSLYVEALEEFYLCNDTFYEECNKYMQCGARF